MKGKATLVLTFALAAVIGMIFLSPVVDAVNTNTGVQSVNENVTADTGSYVELTGYDIDESSVVVEGFNDTSGSYEQASEGTDYELNTSDGSLKALSGSSLIDDGENVIVKYDYQASGGLTTTVVGFIPVMMGTLLLWTVSRGVMKEM